MPICYKQSSRASVGKVQSAICPDDINTIAECIENFNHGWGMVNSAHRWPGPVKFEVGIQIWNLAGDEKWLHGLTKGFFRGADTRRPSKIHCWSLRTKT